MATEAASAGAGAAYEEERRKRILENLKHLEDLGITKMAKSLIQATRQQDKSTRASPKSRKKFEVTTEVRRSSRPRNQVSYKDDFPDDDDFVRRRRFCKDHLPPIEYKMVLEDEEGGEFDVVYIGNRTGLGGGWRGFSMHHDLEDGDSLVFELAEPDRFKIYIFKATEDTNEAKPGDKTAGVDTMDSDSAQEEPDQTDSPVSETPSSPEPLKGAKRRKLHGQQQFSC